MVSADGVKRLPQLVSPTTRANPNIARRQGDPVHPNDEGHALMAQRIGDVLGNYL